MQIRLSLAAIVVIFGCTMPAYKFANEGFGPATTNLIRYALASVVLLRVARGRMPASRAIRLRLARIGMVGLGLMSFLMSIGVDEGSAILASVIIGLEPLGVSLAATLFAGERVTPRAGVALAVGFFGVIVASGLITERSGPTPLLPVILMLGTVVAFSLYTVLVKRASTDVDPIAMTAIAHVGALVFVVPALLFDAAQRESTTGLPAVLGVVRGLVRDGIGPRAVIAALFLGLCSAGAYLLLGSVLTTEPASRVAVALYLTPVVGVFASWLAAGEPLLLREVLGGVLVVTAVAVSESRTIRIGTRGTT